MSKYITAFLIIALFAGGVAYLSTDNLFLTLGVTVTYFSVFFFLFAPMLINSEKAVKRFHECYHFINNFVISLSIKKTIGLASESVVLSMNQEFQDMYQTLQDMNEEDKLKYLSGTYFPFHLYKLFLQVVDLYQEQGGDILKMSKYLLSDLRTSEEYVTKVSHMGLRKYVEIGTLWIICFGILVFMRFTLKDFYSKLKSQILFITAVALLFAFALFSIYILILRNTNIKMKGHNPHEKIV